MFSILVLKKKCATRRQTYIVTLFMGNKEIKAKVTSDKLKFLITKYSLHSTYNFYNRVIVVWSLFCTYTYNAHHTPDRNVYFMIFRTKKKLLPLRTLAGVIYNPCSMCCVYTSMNNSFIFVNIWTFISISIYKKLLKRHTERERPILARPIIEGFWVAKGNWIFFFKVLFQHIRILVSC